MSYSLFFRAFAIDILILVLVLFKQYSELVAIIGGMIIIAYIFFKGLSNPKEAIFIFFGIKLTFDALWEVKLVEIAGIGKIGLLEFMIIPIIFFSLFGPRIKDQVPKWPLVIGILYLAWVFGTMLINVESYLDLNLLVRQACLLFGLLIGMRYIESIEDLNTVTYLAFLSTVIPVLMALLQIILGPSIELEIFHYKMDSIRTYRSSGLYHDAGTNGMVIIVSLITNFYLLQTGLIKSAFHKFHIILIPVCIFIAIAGGTRSIIFITFLLITIFFVANIRQMLLIIPIILLVIIFSKPYLDAVFLKTEKEGVKAVNFTELLKETEYRTMFTGRVGIWQDIWYKHKSGTLRQQLFGTGLSSNAHSSYFFLLLQIGWLGLFLYLFYYFLIAGYLLKQNIPRMLFLFILGIFLANLLIGFSLSTVNYTSFQIATFSILGAGISIGSSRKSLDSKNYNYI